MCAYIYACMMYDVGDNGFARSCVDRISARQMILHQQPELAASACIAADAAAAAD